MVVIVDYGMGNIGSIANMLRKIGVDAAISADPDVIAAADKLILPGVGAFDRGMTNLAERGLIPLLTRRVREEGTPVLGVCLGMQLLSRGSEEGRCPGLAWIDAETVRFRMNPADKELKVPHMGWNTVEPCRSHPILAGLEQSSRFYFVHSYHVVCRDPALAVATTHHGEAFVSVVASGSVLGVQFHPEKSHKFGMQLYRNFAELS